MRKLTLEKELMHRFQQGDALAFNSIYNRHYTSLRNFSRRLTCQKNEAEDITMETFVKLFRLCHNFDNMANIRAFLYVTARNACYDYLAFSHRQPQSLKGEEPETFRDHYFLPEDSVNTSIALQAITQAVDNLPAEYAQVFTLSYIQGHKTTEVARMLTIPEQMVRGHRRHSLKLIRIDLFGKKLPEAALGCLSMIRTGSFYTTATKNDHPYLVAIASN